MRKVPLVEQYVYHVFSRSIAHYQIFNTADECARMQQILHYYSCETPPCKFSHYLDLTAREQENKLIQINNGSKLVDIIAYCIMPHIFMCSFDKKGRREFLAILT